MVSAMAEQEKYGFHKTFEVIITAMSCIRHSFWGRIGEHIDPDMLVDPTCGLIMRACHSLAIDHGRAPDSAGVILQRIQRWHIEGKVSYADLEKTEELIYRSVEDVQHFDEEAVIKEARPVLQRSMERDALNFGLDQFGKKKSLGTVATMLEKAYNIGAVNTSSGITVNAQAVDEVVKLKKFTRLGTGVPELDSTLNGGLPRACFGVIIGPQKGGKCHAAGQQILMHNGDCKKVEDVEVGDVLMGPLGVPRCVLRTNTGVGEMYEIRPKNGKPWRVNADHVLTLAGRGEYEGDVVDVSVKDWFKWSEWKRSNYRLMTSSVEFDDKDDPLPLDPYFLGVLLGDGSFGYWDVRATTMYAEIAECLREQAAVFNLRFVERAERGKVKTYALSGTSGKKNPIAAKLEEIGLRGKTCAAKFIPEIYKRSSTKNRFALLAGLLDTDGSTDGKYYDFTNKSEVLVEDLAYIARSLGFGARVRSCQKSSQNGTVGTYYRLSIHGKHLCDIPNRVMRKKVPRKNIYRTHYRSKFDVIPTNKNEQYFGFTLDGDGRYLLDDFFVTHNSMFLTHVLAHAMVQGLNVALATLEISKEHALARLIANLVDLPSDTIIEDLTAKDAKTRLEYLAKNGLLPHAKVEYFPPDVTTVSNIKDWVKRKEDEIQDEIQVVCTDYSQLFGVDNPNTPSHRAQKLIAQAHRAWAVEENKWIWSGAQPKGSKDRGGKKSKIGMDDVADGLYITRTADLGLSLNPKEEGIMYHVAGFRHGEGGQDVGPFPTNFKYGRMCHVDREGWPFWSPEIEDDF